MKNDEFHKIIRNNGWVREWKTGSHIIYRKNERRYPVPYHKGKEIGKKLEKKIKKDMGLMY